MNDTYVTVTGNVVADPALVVTERGTHVLNMRVASTARRYDRATQEWRDASTLYATVCCWRSLAENVAASFSKGDPVVATGKLRVRSYKSKKDGSPRVSVELDASAVGHDLSRGVARFQKAARSTITERRAAEELAQTWAVAAEQATTADGATTNDGEQPAGDGAVDAEPGTELAERSAA